MIHITLQNNEVLLFDEDEMVSCTNLIHEDYIGSVRECFAEDLLLGLPFQNSENFVLDNVDELGGDVLSNSPIKTVKQL